VTPVDYRGLVVAVVVLGLVTLALVVGGAAEEPFFRFAAVDAYLYIGVGSIVLATWCGVAIVLVRRVRVRPSIVGFVLLAVSFAGLWLSWWVPQMYVEDILQFGGQTGPR
jgi:hypothetical protein